MVHYLIWKSHILFLLGTIKFQEKCLLIFKEKGLDSILIDPKNNQVQKVFSNWHLQANDGSIYRVRIFREDGSNRTFRKLVLYKEDQTGFPQIVKIPEEEQINALDHFTSLEDLYKTYNGVIYGVLDESEDDEKEEGTNVGSTQSAREFHSKKFFWNSMISLVANGDIFKFDQAVELMMYVVMPFFAEKRSLEIIENLENKQRRV